MCIAEEPIQYRYSCLKSHVLLLSRWREAYLGLGPLAGLAESLSHSRRVLLVHHAACYPRGVLQTQGECLIVQAPLIDTYVCQH